MQLFKKAICLGLALFMCASCAQDGSTGNIFTKENIGSVVGAAGGAWAGSNVGKGKGRIVAIAAGTLGGLFIGKAIGSSLDKADQAALNNSTQRALETAPSGQPVAWHNPDSGHGGSVIPSRSYEIDGTPCREFTQTVKIGGKTEQAHGTACRQPDGSWKIQS